MVKISLSIVVLQALIDDRTVEIQCAKNHGFHIVADGVRIANDNAKGGLPIEHFEYPLERVDLSADAEDLCVELKRRSKRRRHRRRMERLNTESHCLAEGEELPIPRPSE
ncbi:MULTISPECIES: hypothetical protein [Halorussus]|uniref:hypothetical protein n=1 Tax=Halorussus TaxID=1070314 RepID=UPI0020A1E045|nr:hypothetical protein [Halorussus vallis]USZ78648.1 hypothetical protein NGM07_25195 [Halorussus vallis]USZ78679.1 hypothetical protein NGM07_24525 [Halorussus vallis]